MELWDGFILWIQCVYLAIKNQIFNRHSMPWSVRKMSRRIVQRLSQTNSKKQFSELVVWSLRQSQKGQFSLTGRGEWYRRDQNTIKWCEHREISILKHYSFIICSYVVHGSHTKVDIPIHLGHVLKLHKIRVSNIFYLFHFDVSLGNRASKMSEKFRLDRKIGIHNMIYTNCINAIIKSIGPSIILRSIKSPLNRNGIIT